MTKTILTGLLMTSIVLISCRSSQKFQASVTADKPLFAAINELNKHPDNTKAQKDLVVFYKQAVERHEDALGAYQHSTDPKRWDKMLSELNSLQHIYNSIQATPGSFSLVRPKNYLKDIEDVKTAAAEDFYNHGTDLLAREGRENNLEAYNAFKKANSYVSGYKDVNKIMKEAYEKSVINVVINPIEEDNLYFSRWNDWGTDFRYRPEDYQQSLVRDLGGRNPNEYAARFYTDREARREGIETDWLVNIRWRNIDPIRSSPQQYSRQASRSVQVGTDTSGKPINQTVYATVYITRNTFTVRGELDYRITDIENNSSIDHGYLSDDVYWDESFATYSGDSRALSQEDWRLINNRNSNNNISRSDILNTLMRKMYPDLRRRIQNALN